MDRYTWSDWWAIGAFHTVCGALMWIYGRTWKQQRQVEPKRGIKHISKKRWQWRKKNLSALVRWNMNQIPPMKVQSKRTLSARAVKHESANSKETHNKINDILESDAILDNQNFVDENQEFFMHVIDNFLTESAWTCHSSTLFPVIRVATWKGICVGGTDRRLSPFTTDSWCVACVQTWRKTHCKRFVWFRKVLVGN